MDVKALGTADAGPPELEFGGWLESATPASVHSAVAARVAGVHNHAEACSVGIVVAVGEPPVVSYANPASRRLARATDHVVVGRPFFEAFPLLANERVRAALCTAAGRNDASQRGQPTLDMPVDIGPLESDGLESQELLLSISSIRDAGRNARTDTLGVLVQVREAAEGGRDNAHGNNDQAAGLDTELLEVNQRLVIAALREQELKERAEAANTAKSMFLATMSHELRTPLNAIIGYASLLDEEMWGPIQEEQHKHLERLKTSARHLLGLITDLLTLARVEADKEVIYTEDVSADAILDEALALTMPMAVAKRLDFAMSPRQSFTLQTDRGKVLQILVNLIGNAIKFTHAGGISVGAEASDGEARFWVTDTGIGIAPENVNHVFDVFWQVEQQLTRRADGAGLGLNVSQRLAHLLGGMITVESVPGEGSTFTLRLPLNRPPSEFNAD